MFNIVLLFSDAIISDDSKDSFQLSKSSSKAQKRIYRKPQRTSTHVGGESVERRKRETSGNIRDRSNVVREEKKRRDEGDERYNRDERYRDGRERSRELYDRERYAFVPKRRDERSYDSGHRSRSPKHHQQKYDNYDRPSSYKSHDQSHDHSRGIDKSTRVERKRSKGYNEQNELRHKKGQDSKIQYSESDSEGEIKPPVKKRADDSKDPYINTLIEDLESHSSNASSDDSTRTPKQSSSSQSPEVSSGTNELGTSTSPVKQKTWRDIADESSESEAEQKVELEKENDDDDKKFSQLSETFVKYSEMQSVSSSENEEIQKENLQQSPTKPDTTEEPMEEELQDVAVGEEEEQEMADLPHYLPALMGCRSVESYEWLNRIEEGTYGVVFRGKDRRTGYYYY